MACTPCSYHAPYPLFCTDRCPMGRVFPDDLTNLRNVLDGDEILPRFFTKVNTTDRPNVARALLWCANHWIEDPIGGPRNAYLDLVADEYADVQPPPTVFGNNVAVPFEPLQENMQHNSCLFHAHWFIACPPMCILRGVFSSTCNQDAFNTIVNIYGRADMIPRFFSGVEHLIDRIYIADALLWETDCWVAHPAGGPWLVYGNLERERALRQNA